MKLDRFINRPVLSTVISVLIVILGIIGLATLPVTQYPDIAPPTVQVRATYTGANSTAVLNSVIAPLEDQINGVENMMYIQSSASNNGAADINVYFNQGTDPDMAAVNVQNRVSMAQGLLPAEVTKVGVTTQKRQNSMLMVFSLYDETDSYNIEFIENYANINLIPEIKRVKGVGDANVLGQDYSMRIWLKPDVMAQYKLVPTDVSAALAEQNIEAAPGQFGERGNQTFQYTIRYKGRLQQTTEFEDIVIKALPDGNVLRLGDVADIELGRLAYTFNNMVNGHKAVSCIVYQMAGSKKVYELHGSVLRNTCTHCQTKYSLEDMMKLRDNEGIPRCSKCGAIIKPDVVLYEEGLDEYTLNSAIHAIEQADLLIVGGTSLVVYPAAGLINYFHGKHLVLINKDSTNMDSKADLVIHDSIGKVLDDSLCEVYVK